MKVLLMNEPYVPGFNRTQRWAARTRGRVLRAPDWLAYATAVLERDGIEAGLYDFPAEGWGTDRIGPLVKETNPDFVVLDSTTPSIYSDVDCARICKENGAGAVIMVGPHVSALPEASLELGRGYVDVVCIGEYDYTVRDVVVNYPRLSGVPGVCFFQDATPVRSAPRSLIEDLDSLPFPAWEHLDLMKYFDGSKLYPYIDVFSGRGCPHGCVFCLWPQVMHGRKVRLRAPERVVDEIERDIKLCPQVQRGGEFFFEDDTFTLVKPNAMAMCEEILKRNLKITFSVNARTDTADPELFRTLKRAGCRELLVGFESGDDEILKGMGKRETVEDSRRFMDLARRFGLEVHGCFVLGLPGETAITMEKTVRFALELDPDTVQFSGAVPFPGTRYFDECKERGLLKTESWDAWLEGGEQAAVIDYPGLSKSGVKQAVDGGLKRFYLRPGYMLRFLFRTRSKADLYRKARGAWNFMSYLISERRVS